MKLATFEDLASLSEHDRSALAKAFGEILDRLNIAIGAQSEIKQIIALKIVLVADECEMNAERIVSEVMRLLRH